MTYIGQVLELWRYPVSSVGGERMDVLATSAHGIVGDRHFAIFDPVTGLPAAPEKEPRWRPVVFLQSRQTPDGQTHLGFPDGRWISLNDGQLNDALTLYFGFPAAMGTYGQAAQATDLPIIQNRYAVSQMHILSTASLEKLAELTGVDSVDSRRFRPTIVIDSEAKNAFLENDWIGVTLRIGELRVRLVEATKRCGMTMIAHPGSAEEPEILRNIVRHNSRNLGIYGVIEHAAPVCAGDPVYAEI